MNGQAMSQGNVHMGTYIPHAQQPSLSMTSSKESTTQQVCFLAKMFVVVVAFALPFSTFDSAFNV